MNKGRIIILSGPSGAGKTTLHQKLLENPAFKNILVKSLSATTRSPRSGETHGKDYLFLKQEEFLKKQKAGHFLESMKVFDNYYGTPIDKVEDALKKGKNVLLCIDVQGARIVSQKFPDALKIFIETPTLADLKERLKNRGTEDPKDLKLRLKIAQDELKEAKNYDYVVVNDDLNRAAKGLEKILKQELRQKPKGSK